MCSTSGKKQSFSFRKILDCANFFVTNFCQRRKLVFLQWQMYLTLSLYHFVFVYCSNFEPVYLTLCLSISVSIVSCLISVSYSSVTLYLFQSLFLALMLPCISLQLESSCYISVSCFYISPTLHLSLFGTVSFIHMGVYPALSLHLSLNLYSCVSASFSKSVSMCHSIFL